jgi:ketosteroid isomerase-like protein
VNLRSRPVGVGTIDVVSDDDLAVARQMLDALAGAAKTGDREALYPFLATDVAWSTPWRDLAGLEDVRENLSWVSPPDNLDVDFGELELADLGDGRIVAEVRQAYLLPGTDETAYTRRCRIELTIRDGKVAGYEMRLVG